LVRFGGQRQTSLSQGTFEHETKVWVHHILPYATSRCPEERVAFGAWHDEGQSSNATKDGDVWERDTGDGSSIGQKKPYIWRKQGKLGIHK